MKPQLRSSVYHIRVYMGILTFNVHLGHTPIVSAVDLGQVQTRDRRYNESFGCDSN